MNKLACFKAYDVRGKLGTELNEDIAYRIGRAYAQVLTPKKVAVGGDVRLTSESLKQALAKGLMDGGADVVDIGLSGTEEIYFAAFHLDVDGGIEEWRRAVLARLPLHGREPRQILVHARGKAQLAELVGKVSHALREGHH